MDESRSPRSRILQQLPLHALQVFDIAASRASFRVAARELGVTPSAISHQVRGLETMLGLRLFERAPRRVSLTSAGHTLHAATRRALDDLDDALRLLLRPAHGDAVTVTTTPAFAARWLVPRLASFESRHPGTRIRLVSTNEVTHLGLDSDVDLAIRYGEPREPHLAVEPLLNERFVAVATPGYARRVEAGGRATLLHIVWRSDRFARVAWPRFLAADAKRTFAKVVDGASFEDESHAVLAALGGQGVALVGDVLVADLLATGAVVCVGKTSVPGYRYHLIGARNTLARAPVSTFVGWLREAAAAFRVGRRATKGSAREAGALR